MKYLIGLLLTVLAMGVFAQTIALTNALLFDGEELHQHWDIVIEGDRITYVGPELPFLQSMDSVIDLEGKTVLPGLIEGHSHLFLHPYNETDWNDQVLKESYAERTVRAVNHAKSTLKAGFTTVRDLGTEGGGYLDVGLKKAIEKGLTPGPHMLVAGPAIVSTGSYGPKGFADHVSAPIGAEVADGDELISVVREQIGRGVDLIKVYADYRWGPFGMAAPTFSEEELKMIVQTAASSGRQVVAHASTTEGMRRAILAGVKTIEHGDALTSEICDLMVTHQVALCPTLAAVDAIMQYRGWKKGEEEDPERIVQKKRSFKLAMEKGVTICAGGDVGVFSHGENVRELELMAEYGMSALDVLRAATSVNATVFALPDRGMIAKGKIADLLVVDGDSSQDISSLRNVELVIKNGQIVHAADR